MYFYCVLVIIRFKHSSESKSAGQLHVIVSLSRWRERRARVSPGECWCAPSLLQRQCRRSCQRRAKCGLDRAEVFPREKAAILIMWNNRLKLPGEDKRMN